MRSRYQNIKNVLYHTFVILFGYVMVYPVLWMIASSLKPNTEVFSDYSLIPSSIDVSSYFRGWKGVGGVTFTTFFRNSFFYSILATIGVVLSSAFVAYGFARIRFWGKKFWFSCMLLTMMLPYQIVMIPQYILFFKLRWVNTFAPLIVPTFFGQAFFIFLMVQFIRGLPVELDESAKIDGCGRLRVFLHIIFPLLTPAIITSVIFQFYWKWDDFLGPLLYLNRPDHYTVSLALRMFSDPTTTTDWSALFAMGSLSLVPIFVIFVFFQRYLVEGISTSGLKA
ncbi:MAG TPA: carbohydrate ABC transporter permease [Termitinemataceae bacterium]|uniref:carbohydrate ABC transporter permease n=1 Tax=Treponema sp. J25 TaxID=2094121 RepID=UPI001043417C|nr:carbohydrate ABC transporter permease [Treponema sp. J25]TCW62443.1 ABC transporter permease [Treponema sp. J25]HOJ99271.1 carbohydrate ABC transporter permease [Termitinemataceae bacterium]HOM23405.1 carbohydrate ABC transporter permease [Termitinemataceae bacterium]HPQ01357.1 carbohydrate ABC transporter permease [Termitinemataceae bacterium]